MPAVTPAYAKNIIRRAFTELVDPGPSTVDRLRLWEHFRHACAYCGQLVRYGAKEGHLDHLVAAAQDGPNALGNRVLTCAPCNEQEKLDHPWEAFLKKKAPSPEEFAVRRQRILDWQKANPLPGGAMSRQLKELARAKADEVVAAFEQAVADVRQQKMASCHDL